MANKKNTAKLKSSKEKKERRKIERKLKWNEEEWKMAINWLLWIPRKSSLGGGSTEYLRNVSFSEKNILFMNFFCTWNNLKFDVSVIKLFFIGK